MVEKQQLQQTPFLKGKKKKTKKNLPVRTELDVALLWCSQRKISLQPEVCTVTSYKMTPPQNRKKMVSILVFFPPRGMLSFQDFMIFTPNL